MKFPGLVSVVLVGALTPVNAEVQPASPVMPRDLHYTITMNGKPVGSSEVRVEAEHSGDVMLRIKTRIDIKFMFFSWRYSATAHETWSGDRLLSAEAETVEDGDISHTQVTRTADGVVVVTDKGERHLTGTLASTSFWNLPRLPDTPLTLLDIESGADFRAQARFVKATEIVINDSVMPCHLWQLAAETNTQLWFDHDDVLLRAEYEEQGQRFIQTLDRLAAASSQEKQPSIR